MNIQPSVKAIFFDFGGVITDSPFEAFNQFERENKIPLDFIRKVNSINPNVNAWAQFEKNQINLEQFDQLFSLESEKLGYKIEDYPVTKKYYDQALSLPIYFVRPSKWKKHFELINASKDASRTKVIEMYPSLSNELSKKKDVNKSDAILIAKYHYETRFNDNPK